VELDNEYVTIQSQRSAGYLERPFVLRHWTDHWNLERRTSRGIGGTPMFSAKPEELNNPGLRIDWLIRGECRCFYG